MFFMSTVYDSLRPPLCNLCVAGPAARSHTNKQQPPCRNNIDLLYIGVGVSGYPG